ncbi:MAG: c-type cytochrome domain-containing protein [Anaerolineae bacterium]
MRPNKIPEQMKYLSILTSVLGIIILLFFTGKLPSAAAAQPAQRPSNNTCLACHQQANMTRKLGDGILYLTIDPQKFAASVHNQENIACTDCHTNITEFPHPALTASTPRDFSLENYTTCQNCHAEQYEKSMDSVHQRALAAGNTNAAICTDCHNPHTQSRLTDKETGKLLLGARLQIPQTCARCHSTIYDTYKASVHGAALTEEGNQYVPTCTDCHGVHNIQDPTTADFRNNTPLLCAKCHTNETIMKQYGISTDVLNTYEVFVPQTATPLPTPIPTNTPLPSPIPEPATTEGTATTPQAAAPSWNGYVGPLFQQKCVVCHGTAALGGLNLSTYADAIKGGQSGPAIIPSDPENSLLIQKQKAGGHPGQLLPEEIAQLIAWIQAGAPEQ